MLGNHLKVGSARAGDLIRIAVATSTVCGESASRDELIKRRTLAVERDAATLGLADLQEVVAYTGQADGLCGSGARVCARQLLQIVVVNAQKNGSSGNDDGNSLHEGIVWRAACADKRFGGYGAFRNNTPGFNGYSWQDGQPELPFPLLTGYTPG